MRDLFSSRELGKRELVSEEIVPTVYNAILVIFNKYKLGLAKEFPDYCSDHNNVICGVCDGKLQAAIDGFIPDFNNNTYKGTTDNYAILDFIEYVYSKLVDYVEYEYHSFMRHNHLSFNDKGILKSEFKKQINYLFERNGITFYLDTDGMIKRHLPLELDTLLHHMDINTLDNRLNELINNAVADIKKAKEKDRIYAIEKLWDAFERLKTYYSANKKTSAKQLVEEVAGRTLEFDTLLDEEFKALTTIGNKFQIRHFEKDKIKIEELEQIDYLFYRMIAIISLCIKNINI